MTDHQNSSADIVERLRMQPKPHETIAVFAALCREAADEIERLTFPVAQPEQLRSSGHAEQNSSSKTWTAGIDALRQYPYQDEQWHIHAIEFHHKVREEAEATRDRWLASQPSPAATVDRAEWAINGAHEFAETMRAAPVDHLLQKAVFASGEIVQDHLPDCSAGNGGEK